MAPLPPAVASWLQGGAVGDGPLAAWVRAEAAALGLPEAATSALADTAGVWARHSGAGALRALVDRLPPAHHGAALRGLAAATGPARCVTLPAALAGAPPPPGLERALALSADAHALLLARVEPEQRLPAAGPLLDAVVGHSPGLALARAGRLEGPARLTALRAALGGPRGRAALDAVWEAAAAPLRADRPDLAAPLDAGWSKARSAAAFTALVASDPWADGPPPGALDAARAAAVAWIEDDPQHRRSWEHQRFGMAGDTAPQVGHHYAALVLLEQLWREGLPGAADRLARHLQALPAAPLRYYGPDWRRIPPDCDSLGLTLLAAAWTGAATAAQRAAWLAPLRPSLRPDGTVPTWLETGPDGPTTPAPRWTFGGDNCAASRAVCLRGLLATGEAAWRPVIAGNLPGVLAGTPSASFYYDGPTAERILAELVAELAAAWPACPLLEAARARRAALQEAALGAQRADGGWGSPQATAERLRLLLGHPAAQVAAARGLRYLGETQRPDGSWASEPFFVTLGKPPHPVHRHGGTELTTALCLAGLRAGASLLGSR